MRFSGGSGRWLGTMAINAFHDSQFSTKAPRPSKYSLVVSSACSRSELASNDNFRTFGPKPGMDDLGIAIASLNGRKVIEIHSEDYFNGNMVEVTTYPSFSTVHRASFKCCHLYPKFPVVQPGRVLEIAFGPRRRLVSHMIRCKNQTCSFIKRKLDASLA